MNSTRIWKEGTVVFLSIIILSLSFIYKEMAISYLELFLSITLVVLVNVFAKKFFANNLETDINLNFWSIKHFGLRNSQHFKKPVPMLWLPIITTLASFGRFVWMPIIEFDVAPKPERISRRHGLYRFTEVTEWHVALIAAAGIFANVFFGIIGYFTGFEVFAKLSIYYAFWSIIPLGRLDGSKILFGSKNLWFGLLLLLSAILIWVLSIV